MSKIFIDTNILVYAMDTYSQEKRERCRHLLNIIAQNFKGVISTQVMQEFYVTATKKLGADPLIAKDILHTFEKFEIILNTPDLIKNAIDCSIINRISFWDALIIVSAENAQCEKIWTEDLNDGQLIRGVRVENPFINLDQYALRS